MSLLASFLLIGTLLGQQPGIPAQSSALPAGQAQPAPPPPVASAPPPTYKIGPQDVLKITVLDEPELTNTYRVDTDGYITFPFIGRTMAAGLTLATVQDHIKSALEAGYIKNPQVRVEMSSYSSQSVLVSGEVRQPGKITMSGSMTVLEALAAAGSPTSSASSVLTVAHIRKPGSDPSKGPDLVRVNWKDLQLGKGTDIALQDGDIINVPKAQTFFITGQVRNGGTYVLDPGTTVQQAIAMAGGITERGSDRRIRASRLVDGKLTDVDLKMEDLVMPNDVITVPQRFF